MLAPRLLPLLCHLRVPSVPLCECAVQLMNFTAILVHLSDQTNDDTSVRTGTDRKRLSCWAAFADQFSRLFN